VLTGHNTDDESSFHEGYGLRRGGSVNTNEEMHEPIASIVGANDERTAGKRAGQVVDERALLNSDVQAVGIPSMDKWPVIEPGDAVARARGTQYLHAAALVGGLSAISFAQEVIIHYILLTS